MHHLRSGPDREWAEFPPQASGAELTLAFETTRNAAERTLRLRHRDLKQAWRVLLNGKAIAQLPFDEADMVTYWTVPADTLRDGINELKVQCTGKSASDDVVIGPIALVDWPRQQVLSAGTVDVAVRDEAGRVVPGRITVVDENGTLASTGNESGPEHAVRPGVVYAGDGAVRLKLPAGRYVIYAGRGFEYGVASTRVEVAGGSATTRQLTIRREVDTAGWAAMDTHLHTGQFARHGDATVEERMLTIAGEGIELPVSAEHNTQVRFEPHAGAPAVRRFFTPVPGSEVTTPALGHFNVFPLPEGSQIDHNAPDWARLAESIARAAPDPVIVLNHGRDVHGGFRPLGNVRHISVAGEDLDGWRLPANAMEIVNSGAVMSDALALPRDWMGMLNRGLFLTPVGSSDSHDVSRYIVGQARTYVGTDDSNPGGIGLARAREAVRRGRVTVSYGLLAGIEVNGKGPGDIVSANDAIDVRVRVQGPGWTRADRVALYANGDRIHEARIPAGDTAGVKWEGTWRLPKPAHDIHLVAVTSGPGVTAPYWPTAKPYQPTSIEFTPYVLGVSGAVFVDADGSGKFESAFEYARRAVARAGDLQALVRKLAAYDAAVAVQAASLLRGQDQAGFEAKVPSMMEAASSEVAKGFAAYLDGWKVSRTGNR
jgi:hypothetical protein